MTSKFPSLVILTELAAQLRKKSMELELGWTPRDQNEEADRLTNLCFDDFNPEMRIDFDPVKADWLVMREMLEVAENIYQKVKDRKQGAGPTTKEKERRRPQERLRERDPW